MITALQPLADASEVSDSTFNLYVAALAISGIALLIVAVLPLGTSVGARVINALLGLAMLGYAFYLFFLFPGGEFSMFWYAFVLPIVVIYQTIKSRRTAAS